MKSRIPTFILALCLAAGLFVQIVPFSGATLPPNPDHIYVATVGTPETVDPHWAYDTASGEIIQNIYEPLCMFNLTETDEFADAIADWWPGYGENPGNVITPSPPDPTAPAGTNQTWYFHVRAGIAWQNPSYGTVKPSDVEYSFERGMLMDHSYGPMWMLYQPLLGRASSYDYDLDGDGIVNASEFPALFSVVTNAIQSNATHVWFNLPAGYAPFQQILSLTWSSVMCKAWSIANGLWNPGAADLYAEFLRTWDLPSPGPLMAPAKAMGSGPYKLKEMNEDPNTGHYTLEKSDGYWKGWGSKFARLLTVTSVLEWSNRKIQFFSADPNSQADLCVVPRANWAELHENRNKGQPVLPGFTLYVPLTPTQSLNILYFTYVMVYGSPYIPLIGSTPKNDLLADRHMRLVLCYLFNFTQHIQNLYQGEAIQSPVCMPKGTRYWNESKPKYDLNFMRAQQELDLAWNGTVKAQGLTMKLIYSFGSITGGSACRILADGLNMLQWGPNATVDIKAIGIPWCYLCTPIWQQKGGVPLWQLGWLTDYPDPHNWFQPFMESTGTYCHRYNIAYGLDSASMNWENQTYGPPPYTNALGESVTGINNTYVDHLINASRQISDADNRRQLLYEELMDISHAEVAHLPMASPIRRYYVRSWIHGWNGTYSENPIAPGNYYYTIYKELTAPETSVDVSINARLSMDCSNITEWLLNQPYHAPKPAVAWMKADYNTIGTSPMANLTAVVTRHDTEESPVTVYVIWSATTASGHRQEFGYAYSVLNPGETHELGPTNISDMFLDAGGYDVQLNLYVLEDSVYNINQTVTFDAGYFQMLGYCDLNGDNVVDGKDYVLIRQAVGGLQGGAKWNWAADVNCDHAVTVADYQLVKIKIPTVYTPA